MWGLRMGLGGVWRPPVGSTAAFTPASLTPDLWIDPSDTATMFQSNAGTTVVTDGSVCGYAGDKSVAAFHLTSAADDTTRPTWVSTGGFPYLSAAAASSQVLRRTTALGLYAASGHSIFFALRGNSVAVNARLFAEGGSGTSAFVDYTADAATATTAKYIQRNDATTTVNNLTMNTLAFDNNDKVWGLTDDGATATGYVNGVAGTPQTATRSGVYTLDRTALFALVRGATSNYFSGRVYGVVAVKRVITAGEIASLTTYLGAKMGLSI